MRGGEEGGGVRRRGSMCGRGRERMADVCCVGSSRDDVNNDEK